MLPATLLTHRPARTPQADGMTSGYFGAYTPQLDEGAFRLFDLEATPGLDTWTYGFHPKPGVVPMGSGAYSKGYVEMWGGNGYY